MKSAALAFAAVLLAAGVAPAQDRIAHANVELILSVMPQTREVARQLEKYQKTLADKLQVKQSYAEQRLTEAQDAADSGAPQSELAELRDELRRLEAEIRKSAEDADRKMAEKREALMEPVLETLNDAIRSVAEADGYTHVLNTLDVSGTSIVLYAIDERDVTERVLEELGIEVPKERGAAGSESPK